MRHTATPRRGIGLVLAGLVGLAAAPGCADISYPSDLGVGRRTGRSPEESAWLQAQHRHKRAADENKDLREDIAKLQRK